VLGLRKLPYWTANYAFDISVFIIPLTFFFVTIYAFHSQTSFITDKIEFLILALFLFSFSFIGYSYLFSFMFQKSSTAYRLFPFFNFLFFFVIPQIALYLDPKGVETLYILPLMSPFIALYACFFT
jgi:hypothetical protein